MCGLSKACASMASVLWLHRNDQPPAAGPAWVIVEKRCGEGVRRMPRQKIRANIKRCEDRCTAFGPSRANGAMIAVHAAPTTLRANMGGRVCCVATSRTPLRLCDSTTKEPDSFGCPALNKRVKPLCRARSAFAPATVQGNASSSMRSDALDVLRAGGFSRWCATLARHGVTEERLLASSRCRVVARWRPDGQLEISSPDDHQVYRAQIAQLSPTETFFEPRT
jgi:hypothetical protein